MSGLSNSINVRPITPALGAEITGADVRTEADAEVVKKAIAEYGVVMVRKQTLEPDDMLGFARRFGEINVNRFIQSMETHPEIVLLIKEAHHKQNIGSDWHTDQSYDVAPAMGTMLYSVETPPCGGDTLFASSSAAYDALSDDFREMLDGLKALHSSRQVFADLKGYGEAGSTGRFGNADAATQDTVHPLVITHPLSGRRCIYVNRTFTVGIEGWSEAESKMLLDFLYDHCVKPEFTCRVAWGDGDLALWDNRATIHTATNDYHGHRREMRRITIEGVPLEGV